MSNRKDLILFAVCIAGNFFCAPLYSLQAPFYPAEAERRHVTPTEYGLVFSIYSVTMIISSPLVGAKIGKVGLKFALCAGIFMCAYSCCLFGILSFIKRDELFFGFSLLIRVFESLGQTAYGISSFTIVTSVFPESANEKLGILCSAFACGTIIGPAVGGVLYYAGGFFLPFAVVGSTLFVCLCLALWLVPDCKVEGPSQDNAVIKQLLKSPAMWFGIYCISACSFCSGFLVSTLEPHLRRFELPSFAVGFFFIIPSTVYAITNIIPGRAIDKGIDPVKIMMFGAVMKMISFFLIGPFPWIPLEPSLYYIVPGLVVNGLGSSAEYTAGFGQLLKAAKESEISDTENTNAAVSSFYQFSMSLGLLTGPTVGGIFLQFCNFRIGILSIIFINIILLLMSTIFVCRKANREPQ